MPRKKKRAGIAYCVVSASIWEGKLSIGGIAIYPTVEERDKTIAARKDTGHHSYVSLFPADIWIEEH